MGQSGTKLVFVLAGLALSAGVISWWYRYEAAHEATMYWGVEASRLISQPSEVEIYELALLGAESAAEEGTGVLELGRRYRAAEPRGLTNARGMVHLRHALMSDRNYEWDAPVDPAEIDWRWCLRFFDSQHEIRVVLAADLAAIGRVVAADQTPVEAFSCSPLSESLRAYFAALGLEDASTAE